MHHTLLQLRYKKMALHELYGFYFFSILHNYFGYTHNVIQPPRVQSGILSHPKPPGWGSLPEDYILNLCKDKNGIYVSLKCHLCQTLV